MTTYHVTGAIEAEVMVEVPNTDIVSEEWCEISVNMDVDAQNVANACETAEVQALLAYDTKRFYWTQSPVITEGGTILETIKNLIPPRRSEDYAYQRGYDCEMNVATEENCHFAIFSSKKNTAAWEAGKRAAAKAKTKGQTMKHIRAQIGCSDFLQVDISVPDDATNDEICDAALAQAKAEFGNYDEIEIIENEVIL